MAANKDSPPFVFKSLATSLALMKEFDDVPLFTRTHLVVTGAFPVLAQHCSSVDSIPTARLSSPHFLPSWSEQLSSAVVIHILLVVLELALILQIICFLVHLELSHHGLITTLTRVVLVLISPIFFPASKCQLRALVLAILGLALLRLCQHPLPVFVGQPKRT